MPKEIKDEEKKKKNRNNMLIIGLAVAIILFCVCWSVIPDSWSEESSPSSESRLDTSGSKEYKETTTESGAEQFPYIDPFAGTKSSYSSKKVRDYLNLFMDEGNLLYPDNKIKGITLEENVLTIELNFDEEVDLSTVKSNYISIIEWIFDNNYKEVGEIVLISNKLSITSDKEAYRRYYNTDLDRSLSESDLYDLCLELLTKRGN